MALRGDLSSLKGLKGKLKELPRSVAHDVAQRAAPALTSLTRGAFDSGKSVYGDARPQGADGRPLTLERTGATKASLKFSATGTIVRAVLGPRYAKYLIGKYSILPNGALPAAWSSKLAALVKETKL